MKRWGLGMAVVLLLGMLLFGCHKKEASPEQAPVSLNQEVVPLFTRSCAVCHRRVDGDGEAVAHGVYYENAEDILAKVGTAILPGRPTESLLLKVLGRSYPVGTRLVTMPPPGSGVPAWSEAELARFAQWILEGAKAP